MTNVPLATGRSQKTEAGLVRSVPVRLPTVAPLVRSAS
jgi:hypothetical protein